MCDIWPCIADISIHLPHYSNMLVAIEKGVFLIFDTTISAAMRGFVSLKACVREYDYQSLSIFIIWGYGDMLLSN